MSGDGNNDPSGPGPAGPGDDPPPGPGSPSGGDPISIITGDNRVDATDLVIPCPLIDLEFHRAYASLELNDVGLGPRWHHNYDWRVAVLTHQTFGQLNPDYVEQVGFSSACGGGMGMVSPAEAVTNSIVVDALILQSVSDPNQPGYQGSRHVFQRLDDGSFASMDNYQAKELTNGYEVIVPGGIMYDFDTNGLLQTIRHPAGQEVALTYQSIQVHSNGFVQAKLDRATHSNGKYLEFQYTGAQIIAVLTPSTNLSLTMSYDEYGDLTNVLRHTCRGDFAHSYEYQHRGGYSLHWLTKRVNPNGEVFRFEYADISGPASRAIASYGEPDYYLTRFDYVAENLTRVTARRGEKDLVTDYYYDPITRRMKTIVGPNNSNWVRNITYDAGLNINGFYDDDSAQDDHYEISLTYDGSHDLTGVAEGYNATPSNFWTADWNQADRTLTRISDPAGTTIDLEYTNSLLSCVRLEAGAGTNFEARASYTPSGLIVAITNANGNTVQVSHDSAGYVTNIAFAVGFSVGLGWDALGHVNAVTLPGEQGPRTIAIEPDEDGRPLNIAYPDGLGQSFKYDAFGNLLEYVDTASRTSSFTYALGRRASTKRVLAGATNQIAAIKIGYDNQLNILSITDELGRAVETYQLDDADRIVKVVNLETQELTATYGAAGFLRSLGRFDGSVVSLDYDGQGYLSDVRFPTLTNHYGWLPNRRLLTADNEAGRISNTWNAANRLASSMGPVPNGSVTYTYYPAGNISNVTSVAGTTRYAYDAAERVAAIESPVSGFRYDYGTNGLVIRVTCTNNGLSVTYGYDVVDRVTSRVWRDGSSNLLRAFAYSYNNADRVTQKVTTANGELRAENYIYDSLDRLITETSLSSVTSVVAYAYDLAGNRTAVFENGTTNVYSLGVGNRLTSWGPSSWAAYDPAGNATSICYGASQRVDLKWNDRYQVTQVCTNGALAESYGYDALGRRIWVSDGQTTNYMVYRGIHVVAEVDETGRLLKSYTYGLGIDNILAMTVYSSTTNTYYYLKDHLGSVAAVLDGGGTVVEQYEYDAWGNVSAYDGSGNPIQQSVIGNRHLWQAREYSWSTGLYYFRARWYHPVTGRWLSKDPIGVSGGLNLYAYCHNDPVNRVDPLGLGKESWWRQASDWIKDHLLTNPYDAAIRSGHTTSGLSLLVNIPGSEDPVKDLENMVYGREVIIDAAIKAGVLATAGAVGGLAGVVDAIAGYASPSPWPMSVGGLLGGMESLREGSGE